MCLYFLANSYGCCYIRFNVLFRGLLPYTVTTKRPRGSHGLQLGPTHTQPGPLLSLVYLSTEIKEDPTLVSASLHRRLWSWD